MRRITSFSSRGNNYTLENVQTLDDGLATMRPQTRRVIGKHGGFDSFGVMPSLAEIGNIRADVIVHVIPGNLSSMTAKLNTLLKLSRESKGFLFAEMEDGTIRFCIARTNGIQAPQSEGRHTEVILRAAIEFQVADPHWYAQGTEAPSWGYFSWGTASWGGTALPHAASGTTTNLIETVSDGNIGTQPRIRVACGDGETAQDIKVQRLVDGTVVDEVLYTGTLTANDVLDIDARKVAVTLNGNDAFDNLTWLTRDWFELLPGDNDIRVVMANAGDSADVTFNYWYKWV